MAGEIAGAPLPPVGDQPIYDVVWCKPGYPLDVTLLGDEIRGWWMHWIYRPKEWKTGRSKLHYEFECPWCRESPDLRWVGASPAWCNQRVARVVLLWSPDAARSVLHSCSMSQGMHGRRLIFARSRPDFNASVLVSDSAFEAVFPIPTAHKIEPTLKVVWKLPDYPSRLTEHFERPPEDAVAGKILPASRYDLGEARGGAR